MLVKALISMVPKYWQRQVVEVAEDNDEDMFSANVRDFLEAPFYPLAPKISHCSHRRGEDDVEAPRVEVLVWVSRCSR
jgi:hypothetical protein